MLKRVKRSLPTNKYRTNPDLNTRAHSNTGLIIKNNNNKQAEDKNENMRRNR